MTTQITEPELLILAEWGCRLAGLYASAGQRAVAARNLDDATTLLYERARRIGSARLNVVEAS